jgi:hypothetical protein
MCPQGYALTGGLCQAQATAGEAPALAAQIAYASANLTLTTAWQNVPGAAITVAAAGTYLVTGCVSFYCSGDTGQNLYGGLSAASAVQGQAAVFNAPVTGEQVSLTQQWIVAVSAGAVLQLIGQKGGGTGNSLIASAGQTSMTAIRVA